MGERSEFLSVRPTTTERPTTRSYNWPAVNCLMVSAQTAGCSSMRKWPAPLSVRRKVRP